EYDTRTGRWTSQDPTGFAAGDANLYRYAGNGPTNAVDPSGLFSIMPSPPPPEGVPWLGIPPAPPPLPAPWTPPPPAPNNLRGAVDPWGAYGRGYEAGASQRNHILPNLDDPRVYSPSDTDGQYHDGFMDGWRGRPSLADTFPRLSQLPDIPRPQIPLATGVIPPGPLEVPGRSPVPTPPRQLLLFPELEEPPLGPSRPANPYLDGSTPLPGTRSTGVARATRLEIEMVQRTGSGTLNWTPEEIDFIRQNGRLPDGIVGHHINNVAQFPEWAGDPRNIQFVRGQPGNLAAHGGNFQTPTTGPLINRP
ncbi:MAG TPA: RHS repeat-associated core domain-containing protein, partial [bacterium]|nr:RHS repeat-associated core domain-containing protein [bacterium]